MQTMKQSFKRIHQAKIRARKAQIRARASGKKYDGICLAKLIDPEVLRRPLNLSGVVIPDP
jgi:hypothetical protein